MNTPICDFVAGYIRSDASRLHVPGHKGAGLMGCEPWDLTEVAGADALFEASGIIAESERNASLLFGTGATFYSCEGSSLCIRAMLALAASSRRTPGKRPVALAARNAHRAFVYAAALIDFDVAWLYPDGAADSICACPVTPAALEAKLHSMAEKPFCVYVTSPDYLGGMQDVRGLSRVCHAHGVPLIVDNAHGAYLKFLKPSLHPIDLGADMCCDSAHKTLPVLTGGAYLHISKAADARWARDARLMMAMFGSTSPSYLILESLDRCNAALAGDWPDRLAACVERVGKLKKRLSARGFELRGGEPMKLTIRGDGLGMAARLRKGGVECEYADRNYAVLMPSPDNRPEDFERVAAALTEPGPSACPQAMAPLWLKRAMTIREAVFSPGEMVPVRAAEGRVCAAPTVACPPAVPIAVSGEIITRDAVEAFERNGVDSVRVCL